MTIRVVGLFVFMVSSFIAETIPRPTFGAPVDLDVAPVSSLRAMNVATTLATHGGPYVPYAIAIPVSSRFV